MTLSLSDLYGNLQDLRFPRILATLSRDCFTGVIQVTSSAGETDLAEPDAHHPTTTREIHLSGGHIAWAISTDKQESLRAFLESGRTITDSQWNAAEERAREGSLREALTALGLVKASELSAIETARAEAIVLELFSMQEGEYRVRERQLSPGTPDLEIEVRPLLLKGLPERADREFLFQEVGSLDAIFSPGKRSLEDADLPSEYSSLAKQIDGKRSIARICSETGLPDNFVLSLMAGLILVGDIDRVVSEPLSEESTRHTEPEPEPEPVEAAPVLQEDGELEVEEEEPILEAIEVIDDEPAEAELVEVDSAGYDDDRVESGQDEGFLEEIEETIEEIPESVYGEGGRDSSARRWFLVGGAAAVGFVALLLILAAQNRGDAGELSTLAAPAASTIGAEDVAETSASMKEENPESEDIPRQEPEPLPRTRREISPDPVAESNESPILSQEVRGDDPVDNGSASGRIDRSATVPSGDFTIKLLTACQEATVQRAIAKAGQSRDLFILPASIGGRSCKRLYWGGYATREQAQRALRRDVPSFFRNDRNPPTIVSMP